jgi:hypothetical protein
MKTRISLSIILVLALSAFVVPLSAGAAEKYKAQYESQFVYAVFSESLNECVELEVWISAGETLVKEQTKGRPHLESWSSAWIEIGQWNWCDEEYPSFTGISGYAELPASSLNIDKKLASATLSATDIEFEGYVDEDWNESIVFTVDNIDLVWEATGPAMTGRSTSQWKGPDLMYKARGKETFRWAEATGEILYDGSNVTAYPSSWAEIGKSSGSWMEIIK